MEKKLSVVGIDFAKQVFHLVGMDAHGTIVVRKRLYRAQVMAFIAQLPPHAHWHGSLWWGPLLGAPLSRARASGVCVRATAPPLC
jgi:hypothetical protein